MIRLATVFSGIGSIEQALKQLGLEHKIVFACDNGERYLKPTFETIIEHIKEKQKLDSQITVREIISDLYDKTGRENYVKKSYFANYDISEDSWYEDIRFLDGKKYHGQVDLFVGGSPCQSFSLMGKRAGLEDARGTLFYDYARLVHEIQPKVFIFENVPGMLAHDNGNTWKVIYEVFESLNYKLFYSILNAVDYGIPQNRERLFLVGFKHDVDFHFPEKIELTKEASDFLEEEPVALKHYLGQKGFEFVTNPKYKNRARLNCKIIKTQKANQQFNWNGDFVFLDYERIKWTKEIFERAYIGEWNGVKGICRQMTYRECLRLMGFADDFKIVVPNVPAYRQSGNSIVVNVLKELVKEILKVEKI